MVASPTSNNPALGVVFPLNPSYDISDLSVHGHGYGLQLALGYVSASLSLSKKLQCSF